MYMVSLLTVVLCLMAASIEDMLTHKVADFIWWICAPACLLILPFSQTPPGFWDFFECLFAIFIQEHIMCRFYGRADSHAFSCCAAFLIFFGTGLEGHILHMIFSLIFLSVHQLIRHNIGNRGKLISPVPFIPYISIAFVITVFTVIR
ncbi:MAG: hypothetical protein J5476_14450 [Lachnospiraceae bacterium]|nr:hypothetical protein [Lachnospiraceae bacterium]